MEILQPGVCRGPCLRPGGDHGRGDRHPVHLSWTRCGVLAMQTSAVTGVTGSRAGSTTVETVRARRARPNVGRIVLYVVAVLVSIIVILPFLRAIFESLTPADAIFD